MPSAWNAELDQRITELYRDHSASEVSRELAKSGHHFSRCAIQGRLYRIGIKIDGKDKVDHRTRDDLIQKPKAPKEKRTPPSQVASSVIAGIRRREKYQIKPEPFVVREPCDIDPRHVGLMDLSDETCRWPYGDDPAAMTFCGCYPLLGHPYCASHCRIAYHPAAERKRAA